MRAEDTKNTTEAVVEATESPVFTPERAARYLNLGSLGVKDPVAGVRYLTKRGVLRGVKILGRLAFLRDDLDRFLTTLQGNGKRNARK